MKACDCNSIEQLMKHWKSKPPCEREYVSNKQRKTARINHEKNNFIPDGIVDEQQWKSLQDGKRILFILKEAYNDKPDEKRPPLNDRLRDSGPWDSIWHRVCEWTRGIIETTAEDMARFVSMANNDDANGWLRKIAVMNVKKSDGRHTSDYAEISAYADADSEEIIREIELIDPDIVVCGATCKDISRITGDRIITRTNDHWFYYSDAVGGKSRLFIDYFHPSNRYPALLNYYGIVSIYQLALRHNEND